MAASLPETMRAAYVERLTPSEESVVGALAVPVPGATDVLVAVELVAANPMDTFVRSGRYPTRVPPPFFPFVVGRDLVGTVAASGLGTPFGVEEQVLANSLGRDGSAAIAMARSGGPRVVTNARPADYDHCREASTYAVVDYSDPDFAGRLLAAAPDSVDLFWETSGHHDLRLATEAATPGDRLLLRL